MKIMQSGRYTVRRQIIFRRTCAPAILFWAYSYWNFAGLENDGVEQEQTYNTAYDEKL